MKHVMRILAVLLCVTLLLGLVGCGQKGVPSLKEIGQCVNKKGDISADLKKRIVGVSYSDLKEAWGTYGNPQMSGAVYWRLEGSDAAIQVWFGLDNKTVDSVEILHRR